MDNLSTKLGVVNNDWDRVLENIKNRVSMSNYRTWFAKTKGQETGDDLCILVPSAYVKEQLATKLADVLREALDAVYGRKINLQYKIDSTLASDKPQDEMEFEFNSPKPKAQTFDLNPKYTMASFVVGLSNNLAYAAAQAIIQNPGISYNPLFIYGGTGVGKTHLMHAIGNGLLKKKPGIKIVYCSSEGFTNAFIESLQTKKTNPFRNKYRFCDLLLIDDIQFIAGRDSTQEEFFHTFNELQGKNAQIVLTSDRPPNEMQKLEARLASRFQGGLMVDIQNPDFDTRVAILRAKCAERKEDISEECLTAIAEAMPTNARELEGKLIQIIQTIKMKGEVLSPDVISAYLGQPATNGQKIDYRKVLTSINHHFNLKMVDMVGPRRNKELVLPRQMAMYILYEECKLPYERIGELLGGRDHTTIMHGVDKIHTAVSRDRDIQKTLIEIKQNLS